MEWTDQLAYDNEAIRNIPAFVPFVKKLQEVSDQDYHGKYHFNEDIECLSLDTYERQFCKAPFQKTSDAAIGIRKYNGNQLSKPFILLVELRMGYKSANNLDQNALCGKVSHSKCLVRSETQIPVDSNYLFIFDEHVIGRVRRWFRDVSIGSKGSHYIPVTVEWFNDRILSPADYPYRPINDLAKLNTELQVSMKGDIAEFLEYFKAKLRWVKEYQYRNPNEYEALVPSFAAVWQKFRNQYPSLELEDQELSAEILEEDYHDILLL